ncbi:MAG TPA: SAF domain-containing protein [Nocardioides sp.]|nr:SAF domain-containing protein [Nocardioides sp.]
MSISTRSRQDDLAIQPSPPATRARRSWRDPRLLVGVAIVAAAALVGATVVDDPRTTPVWAARGALAEGQELQAGDLAVRELRFADPADAARYVAADGPVPEGLTLRRDVGAGELVPVAALGDGTPPLLEVPLSVAPEAVPATVREGSVVDVWVAPDPSLTPGAGSGSAAGDGTGAGTDAVLVFSSVQVVAVSRSGGALGPAATRQVIVGLEPGARATLPEALGLLSRGSAVLVRTP